MASIFDKLIESAQAAATMRAESERGFPDEARSLVYGDTPSEMAFNAAFAPVGTPLRLGALAASAMTASPDAEAGAGGLAKLAARSGPALRAWLDEAIGFAQKRRLHDTGEAERIETIARELPLVPRVFSPQSVAEKAVFAEPQSLVQLTPQQFEQTAWPLDMEAARPYIDHYKDLIMQDRFVDPDPSLFQKRYVDDMRSREYKGFSDIPFLRYRALDQDNPGLASYAVGHEGRHRNRAIAELFGEDAPSLVHLIPNTREHDARVRTLLPEVMSPSELRYRQSIDVPRRRFASGGLLKAAKYFDPELGAFVEESETFGREFPRHSDDGPGDAARHAYMASRVARKYSPGVAGALGSLYEMMSLGADRRSSRMDKYNNEIGVSLHELENEAAKERIREMIKRNQLETLPAGYSTGY